MIESYDLSLKAFADKVERRLSAGLGRDESRWDREYLYKVINDARAEALRVDFIKNRRWNPSAIKPFYTEFSADMQTDACMTVFNVPAYISADGIRDGIIYVGSSSDGKPCKFTRIYTRNQANEYKSHPLLSKETLVLFEAGIATVWHPGITRIRSMMIEGVEADPRQNPAYNVDKDPYPIPRDMSKMIEDIVVQVLGLPAASVQDKISDSSDKSQAPAPRR